MRIQSTALLPYLFTAQIPEKAFVPQPAPDPDLSAYLSFRALKPQESYPQRLYASLDRSLPVPVFPDPSPEEKKPAVKVAQDLIRQPLSLSGGDNRFSNSKIQVHRRHKTESKFHLSQDATIEVSFRGIDILSKKERDRASIFIKSATGETYDVYANRLGASKLTVKLKAGDYEAFYLPAMVPNGLDKGDLLDDSSVMLAVNRVQIADFSREPAEVAVPNPPPPPPSLLYTGAELLSENSLPPLPSAGRLDLFESYPKAVFLR